MTTEIETNGADMVPKPASDHPRNRPSDPAATHAHLKTGMDRMQSLQALLRILERSALHEFENPGDVDGFICDVGMLAEMARKMAGEVYEEIDLAGVALYYRDKGGAS